MKCKYCEAELESNSSVCPACGKDNLKDNLKGLKITALVLVCVVMLVLLAGLVCYGVTGSFTPWNSGDGAQDGSSTDSTTPSTQETLSPEDEAKMAAMDDVVVTLGEHTMTNRQLQLYYWTAAYSYGEKADLTGDLNEQVYDEATGQTYHEYFMEKAVEIWQRMIVVADQARAEGYELPQEYLEELEGLEESLDTYASYYGLSGADEMVKVQFGQGCDFETYYEYAELYYYSGIYWDEKTQKLEVTDAEIDSWFAENEETLAEQYGKPINKDFGNVYDVRSILIAPEKDDEASWAAALAEAEQVMDLWEAEGLTEEAFIPLVEEYTYEDTAINNGGLFTDLYAGSEALVDVRHILIEPKEDNDAGWAEALTEAEGILDQWLAGDKTEESFGALANEHSDDQEGEVTDGGIYADIYMGQMVEPFEEWCFDESRQVGDYGIVKTQFGYHIMYFVHADRAYDNWLSDASRAAGDHAMIKTDDGYRLVYFVESEPAWLRYSRYGAQNAKADAIVEGLIEENPCTVDHDKVVLFSVS